MYTFGSWCGRPLNTQQTYASSLRRGSLLASGTPMLPMLPVAQATSSRTADALLADFADILAARFCSLAVYLGLGFGRSHVILRSSRGGSRSFCRGSRKQPSCGTRSDSTARGRPTTVWTLAHLHTNGVQLFQARRSGLIAGARGTFFKSGLDSRRRDRVHSSRLAHGSGDPVPGSRHPFQD